jgi:hypothetical protein
MKIEMVIQWLGRTLAYAALGDDTVVIHRPGQHHVRRKCQTKDHPEGDLSGRQKLEQECARIKSHGLEA